MKPSFHRTFLSAAAIATSAITLTACMNSQTTPDPKASQAEPVIRWTATGFDQPESVVFDPVSGTLFVSNINGGPTELNNTGYISQLSTDGTLIQHKWATGLDAPKGLTIVDGKLYVADMQRIHILDVATGQSVATLTAPSSVMLNDVAAAPDGTVYVSDLLGGGVYRIKEDSSINTWISPDTMPHSNGVLYHKGELFLASWGHPLKADFTTDVPGSVYRVNQQSGQLTLYPGGEALGNLDGLVSIHDTLYVSDWIQGTVFKLDDNSHATVIQAEQGLADIANKGNTLYAPMMMNGTVVAWTMPD